MALVFPKCTLNSLFHICIHITCTYNTPMSMRKPFSQAYYSASVCTRILAFCTISCICIGCRCHYWLVNSQLGVLSLVQTCEWNKPCFSPFSLECVFIFYTRRNKYFKLWNVSLIKQMVKCRAYIHNSEADQSQVYILCQTQNGNVFSLSPCMCVAVFQNIT